MAWLLVVGLSVAVFIAAFSPFVANFHSLCGPQHCDYMGQLTPSALHQVTSLGISFDAYAAYRGALAVLSEIVWLGIAVFLFVRRSYDRGALFVSLALALQQAANPANLLAKSEGPWRAAAIFINALAWAALMLVWYVFPNGRFVPYWTRWAALLFVVLLAASIAAGITVLNNGNLPGVLSGWYLPFFAGVILAPLYRYRKVATSIERQQMKWPVLAVSVVVLALNRHRRLAAQPQSCRWRCRFPAGSPRAVRFPLHADPDRDGVRHAALPAV